MTSPPLLLQHLPPISATTTSRQSLKPPRRAHDSAAGARIASPPYAVACSRTKSGRRGSGSDDYHATLKALNSRGRFPRKSLGQVFHILNFSLFCFSRKENDRGNWVSLCCLFGCFGNVGNIGYGFGPQPRWYRFLLLDLVKYTVFLVKNVYFMFFWKWVWLNFSCNMK